MKQESELVYAGFWVRVWASLIDTVLLGILLVPPLMAIYGRSYWSYEGYIQGPADLLLSYVVPAILIIVLWCKMSTTPGKMAIGARIVEARTGGKPSMRQFIIRYAGYYLSMLVFFLGFIWVGVDRRKQGWHDKLAGTVVVRRRAGTTEAVRFEQSGPAA